MIIIDGVRFNATWISGFTQTADIINGEGSGRLQGTNAMYLEYSGTFFNHTGELHRDAACTNEDWNRLFLVLSNPINKHTFTFAFGQNQNLTQEVYISQVTRTLKRIDKDGENIWEKVYKLTLPAVNVAWTPNGNIEGVE
jgi:hypothetical protein